MSDVRERVKAFATDTAPKLKRKKEWRAPTIDDFLDGAVLAYDQGAFKTGYCYLWKCNGEITVLETGVFKEPPLPDLRGHADTLQRATWMFERIVDHVRTPRLMPTDPNEMWVVHEMPPVQGYRPELSLMGALAVRYATERTLLRVVSVANTHMRSVLTPPGSDPTSKKPITEALQRYGLGTGQGWNGDTRDACALALTFLYDEKVRRDAATRS